MKFLLTCALALLVAGCVSVPQHSLKPDQIASFRLVGVSFSGEENIISWPSEEAEFLKQPGISPELGEKLRSGPDTRVPEIRPFFAKRLAERVAPIFQNEVGAALKGDRPVKAVIRIQELVAPSTALRVFVNNGSSLKATITLVDATTSAELVKYEGRSSFQQNPGGVAAIALSVTNFSIYQEDNLFQTYFYDYRRWLLKE